MNDKFEELTKGMAQSVTRRGALKKFGLGLAGVVLAGLGLTNNAEAKTFHCKCHRPDYGCSAPGAPLTCYNDCYFVCAPRP